MAILTFSKLIFSPLENESRRLRWDAREKCKSTELPKGFVVPKFTMYDGMNDPFDHIMHFKQLMTLDIGNDTLMCKVFLTSLHDQTFY